MRSLIELNRELYGTARLGVALLPPASARCVATALALYSQILGRIEAADYDVFSRRARVPTWRKAVTAVAVLVFGPRVALRRTHVIPVAVAAGRVEA